MSPRDEALAAATWPADQRAKAIAALAAAARLDVRAADVALDPLADRDADVVRIGEALGIMVEPLQLSPLEIAPFMASGGPALIALAFSQEVRIAAIVGARGDAVELLGPDGRHTFDRAHLVERVRSPHESSRRADAEAVAAAIVAEPRRRARVARALVDGGPGDYVVRDVWYLRPRSGGPLASELLHAGAGAWLAALGASHAAAHGLWVVSWWLLAQSAIHGGSAPWLLVAWVLVLVTRLPFQLSTNVAYGRLRLAIGSVLKRRVLAGALRLGLDDVLRQGPSQLFGTVLESETLEASSVEGTFAILTAAIELAISVFVLARGHAPLVCLALLGVALGVFAVLVRVAHRLQIAWTSERLTMTHRLVDRMIGYRTRLVQERIATWHVDEDIMTDRYLARSAAFDRVMVALAGVPRAWVVAGFVVVGLAFARGAPNEPLLVALGGIIVAFQAMGKLATGTRHLLGAVVAARTVAPVLRAAREEDRRDVRPVPLPSHDASRPLVTLSGVSYGYRPGQPVLTDCNLSIARGARVLVEGGSGGGKSTIGALLGGLRTPDAGFVHFRGLDVASLGLARWRARVAGAPQFHQNHVFNASLAFNVLLGKRWPPRKEDLVAAEALLRECGLGPVLDRMPSGMDQVLGDTGWQLSHGERSRLFIVRALLQAPDVLVLDESFAALDPGTLARTMEVTRRHADTLVVIAHP